ncbi:hypothetical protein L5515_002603 [Caenorhabditis briggsae]|uniref:G-protein coupled receptors family 1 profile domain-containing protein n=1 Tax=Caenorhabditis briggsae TaxID=6238 RepID=A0AAE9E4G5_CAEBR|nr:hypothetical protein L5515_002603 [Caenorhabditis briggsae]
MMVIGVVGNALVVVVVSTNKSMRNALNLVLMNLAIADLLILLFCLPLTVVNDVTKTFWFSAVFCKSVNFINNTSVYVSIMSLVFITCERWRAITYPLKSPFVRTRSVIAGIWLLAMFLSSPEPVTLHLAGARFVRPNFTTQWGTRCKESWSEEFQMNYQLVQTIFSFVLPLLVISVLCLHMVRTLHFSSNHLSVASRQISIRKKAVRMLCAVVMLFAISNLPVHLYNIALNYGLLSTDVTDDVIAVRKLLPRVFSYSSSCLNPILYSFLSGRFREEFGRVVCCLRDEKSSREFRRKQASLYASSQRVQTNSCSTMLLEREMRSSLIIRRPTASIQNPSPPAPHPVPQLSLEDVREEGEASDSEALVLQC